MLVALHSTLVTNQSGYSLGHMSELETRVPSRLSSLFLVTMYSLLKSSRHLNCVDQVADLEDKAR